MKKNLNEKIDNIPSDSGVYKFLNNKKEIIYIGKAKNLKKRVKSYFLNNNHSIKTKKMVEKITDLDFVITNSETEALILESSLVHEIKPKFNILLRDDKNFLYLNITNDDFPIVQFIRKKSEKNGKLFGPYTSAKKIRKLLDFLRSILKFRTCKINISQDFKIDFKGQKKSLPCFDYQIQKCTAPCDKKISIKQYNEDINKLIDFLKGNSKELSTIVQEKMMLYAKEQKFEQAQKMKEILHSLGENSRKQIIELQNDLNMNVIGFFYGKNKSYFHILFIRNGKVISSENFSIESLENEKDTFLTFLRDHIFLSIDLPNLILIPNFLNEEEMVVWNNFLSKRTGCKSEIRIPEKGDKRKIVELANKNAKVHSVNSSENIEKIDILKNIQSALKMNKKPRRIECFDISHFAGNNTVASKVVFFDGNPKKSEYRHYKIKTLKESEINDFKSMEEVVCRRLKSIQKQVVNFKIKEYQKKINAKFQSSYINIKELYEIKNLNEEQIALIAIQYYKKNNFLKIKLNKKIEPEEEIEIIKLIILQTEEKTLKIKILKKDLKFKILLKQILFKEEKNKEDLDYLTMKISTKEFKDFTYQTPDLIVIDGGKGQLSSAFNSLVKLNMQDEITICSLAKKEEEVFIISSQNPINIKKNSPEGYLLQKIRDEAHRFAITYHRKLREKI